ncbi:MAG: MFS transporter [Verrucomicrobiales bacterium]
MTHVQANGVTTNANRLLWAGFMAILAAGIGFAIRGGILDNWGREFGFTGGELGLIGGAGFTGFCFGIIIGGVIADKIGYGKLVVAAFLFHILSAFVTFAPHTGMAKEMAYNLLFIGTFIFAVANGTLEAVANPLVATLFPHNRTHYLNILHASWPAGLVIGGAAGWVLDDQFQISWKIQLALFLLPTLIYGVMFFGQHFPKSEASEKGLSLGQMFKDVGILGAAIACFLLVLFIKVSLGPILQGVTGNEFFISGTWNVFAWIVGIVLLAGVAYVTRGSLGHWMLFILFIAHVLVGAVELGTDQWIQNITGNILSSAEGKILFVWTSLLMFSLRFCADFIEKRLGLSPVGILVVCSVLAAIGLNLVSGINTFIGALLALSVYAVGKTFFWPTMLAVASDRFPRTGAIAISIMGGLGMMSAGLIGSPGLGYAKDRFAGEELHKADPAVFEAYRAPQPSTFLFFEPSYGLDGKKLGDVQKKVSDARVELEKADKDVSGATAQLPPDERLVHETSITGDRRTLVADSVIPTIMAVIYLLLLLYFKTIGGYRPVHIGETEKAPA